ncbi:rab-GTPase-TBC domain-containing protein [Xylariales sp. PMI_506]|nr:rab-GTPase-TBC domain-containing protein [Xylariales sp. PMI_506]
MRSPSESTIRWEETIKYSSSLSDLQRAVRYNGPSSPCVAGCRSICWKAFVLGRGSTTANWSHTLLESRSTYASLREHFLKYIQHPEYLSNASADPLADDADSPWNTLRQDEILRAEILQDVQRLPDEPFYHQPQIQTLILDVLFIYCKLNPEVGGYRQGMHELLAPIVYVVEKDAINPMETASEGPADLTMVELLDANFVEHDSFALFSKLMERAKEFYETGEGSNSGRSTIVEKSQHIHEVLLYKVDPDLSNHLKNIEVLPQIFLIRWVRLLFSREFPFDQMLILWDTLFAVDPTLELVDLVCTSMLIRIRWELLDADYSVALQLLLKYPAPQAPHGPHTFVDDAVYLRDHLTTDGGSTIIMKYTGKPPVPPTVAAHSCPPRSPPPSKTAGLGILQSNQVPKLPLSPSRFIRREGGVEALFQGAAKGVLERGEKLGINQAVRDALVEIRRNVNEARSSMKAGRDLFAEPNPHSTAIQAVATMDRRNKRLASMLDETITALRSLVGEESEVQENHTEVLQTAAAKIQFVKVYLEDSTIALPDDDDLPLASPTAAGRDESDLPTDAVAAMVISTPEMPKYSPIPEEPETAAVSTPTPTKTTAADEGHINVDAMETDPLSSEAPVVERPQLQRPQAPIPTRSTLAQSSFSWMLEPGEGSSASSSPTQKPVFTSRPRRLSGHRKNPTREKTAFLFGEVPLGDDGSAIMPDDIFGLQPWKKGK